MNALRACIRKEWLLLIRDLHGLALLFLMPLTFVIIMSLALQNQFNGPGAAAVFRIWILDEDKSEASAALVRALAGNSSLTMIDAPNEASIPTAALHRGDFAFAVRIHKTFGDGLLDTQRASSLVTLHVAPDTGQQGEALVSTMIRAMVNQVRMEQLMNALGNTLPARNVDDLDIVHAYAEGGRTSQPSSVQQSVPAWLVFGAFFIVVPLSNTLIRERQQGTHKRLRSTNLSPLTLLLGKLVPYFCINQLQVLTMLLAGRYLVPALGGDALHINGSMALLALMATTLSFAALGWALLIAVSSRTTEQATLLGGAGNIILAAIGGIMVPKFIMPPAMQQVASWSPMSWGLEGLLDVLLRNGSWQDVLPEAARLTFLGVVAILLAWRIHSRSEN